MAIIRWHSDLREFSEPGSDYERLRQGMEWLLGSFGSPAPGFASRVFPAVNVTEDKDNYYLRAELPGIKSEEIDIEVAENRISIHGERKIPLEKGEFSYHRRERDDGAFRRILSLPMEIDAHKVKAEMRKGILKITLPKHEKAKPRKIQIGVQ